MTCSVAAILVLTLTPHPGAMTVPPGFCILCGPFGTANLIRNVVLFVPLGIGAGIVMGVGMGMGPGAVTGAPGEFGSAETADRERSRRFLRGWLPAVGLTAGIELAQNVLPGRNPLLVDFLANAAGAAVGMFLVGCFVRGAVGGVGTLAFSRHGVLQAVGWWGLSAVVLAGTALAFRLAPPPPPHHVQVQADLGQFDRYAGAVGGVWLADGEGAGANDARTRGERLEIGRYPDPDQLVARIFGGSRVVVDFVAGAPPNRISPLFSIYTGAQREVVLLGVQGEDALVRLPYLAATLLLDQPDHRLRGALRGLRPGDVAELTFQRGGESEAGSAVGGACLHLTRVETSAMAGGAGTAGSCGLRPSIGQGWTLLLYPSSFPPLVHSALTWGWLLGLGLVPGLFSRSVRAAGLGGIVLIVVGGTAPWLLGSMAVMPTGQGLALLAGALLGWWARTALVAFLSVTAARSNP